MKTTLFFLLVPFLVFQSCGQRNENKLSEKDLAYINRIIPLDQNEVIELFETNGGTKGFKAAGNFITNKRLAHYWIDGKNDAAHSLKYDQIDSLVTIDRTRAATYASYIEVYGRNGYSFRVYIDADSSRTWNFFNKAIQNWQSKK